MKKVSTSIDMPTGFKTEIRVSWFTASKALKHNKVSTKVVSGFLTFGSGRTIIYLFSYILEHLNSSSRN